uniref:Uncharacterized protein n=1 Tax=Siphoviridae sp. ctMAv2 TaxID=2826258 RepID=A0A8S5LSC8_9CAUD|nr:MAG TPA: hypothetical protein [Siphoviridae sp. ctMAv2]
MRRLRHKLRGFILFQFSHLPSPPQIKIATIIGDINKYFYTRYRSLSASVLDNISLFSLVKIIQQDAKSKFRLFAGRLNIPASIVVGDPLTVHLKAQFRNHTTVDAVILARFFKRFQPVFYALVSAIPLRDSDCSF